MTDNLKEHFEKKLSSLERRIQYDLNKKCGEIMNKIGTVLTNSQVNMLYLLKVT